MAAMGEAREMECRDVMAAPTPPLTENSTFRERIRNAIQATTTEPARRKSRSKSELFVRTHKKPGSKAGFLLL